MLQFDGEVEDAVDHGADDGAAAGFVDAEDAWCAGGGRGGGAVGGDGGGDGGVVGVGGTGEECGVVGFY